MFWDRLPAIARTGVPERSGCDQIVISTAQQNRAFTNRTQLWVE